MNEMVQAGGTPAPQTAPVLKAERISRRFIDGDNTLTVLNNVSLELHGGVTTALVGLSGCGKSTLLHILGLLDTPDEGEVFVESTPAGKLSESDRSIVRNGRIGFVFQHFFLLPDFTVFENVLMPAKIHFQPHRWFARRADCEARAHELIKSVGLEARAHKRPRTLSGGERQRVALARALFLEPNILLCDEPTGNLDSVSGGHIMDLILEASATRGAAVLIVTHDAALAARARRTLTLEAGVLKE